jgi:hypothetical protein
MVTSRVEPEDSFGAAAWLSGSVRSSTSHSVEPELLIGAALLVCRRFPGGCRSTSRYVRFGNGPAPRTLPKVVDEPARGYVPEALEDSEYVDFSPTDEFEQVMGHITAQRG